MDDNWMSDHDTLVMTHLLTTIEMSHREHSREQILQLVLLAW